MSSTKISVPMQVSVATTARFSLFDVARQLHRFGVLNRLYTGYPRSRVDGLPPERVAAFPWLVAPMMLAGRLYAQRAQRWLNRVAIETLDRWLLHALRPCNVLHSLSGVAVEAQAAARERYGALTVCARGSTHIEFQRELLEEEHARLGFAPPNFENWFIDRELEHYEQADIVLVPSSFAQRSFLDRGFPASKVRAVPYGVDLRTFRPVPKEDAVFRVLFVGTAGVRKGIAYLLDALADLDLPNFELMLIGGVENEGRVLLERYRGRYRYTGHVPRDQLFRYYSQGSVLVLPSLEEGMAAVQGQAMACGVPVIATANAGAEDLFIHGIEGFIVPARDSQAIREKVLYLYEHPAARDAMARAAMDRARSLRGWEDYGERLIRIYQECARLI